MKERETVPQAPLPVSRAGNAYDLLDDVCRAIIAQPARYNQEHWLLTGSMLASNTCAAKPACGTVACIAGWVEVLSKDINPRTARHSDIVEIGSRAAQMLGFRYHYTGERRYDNDVQPIRALFSGDMLQEQGYEDIGEPGSASYAEAAVKEIRRFMWRYEDRLRAKVVPR